MRKRAVIIGAGPAGLTAAEQLLTRSQEWDVLVLEASKEIGGIARTVRVDGHRMDIGGHRFFSKDARVNAWWEGKLPLQGAPSLDDLLLGRACDTLPGGPDPAREDAVMLSRTRVSRIYYNGKLIDYPVSLSRSTLRGIGPGGAVRAGFGYARTLLGKRPERSLEDFYINRFGKPLYQMFFEGYTEKLWGRHPRDIAPDWGAQRVKGLSVLAVLRDMAQKALGRKGKPGEGETSLIEAFHYPKYGPGQLWERTAEEIVNLGGAVRTDCRVTDILLDGARVTGVRALCGGQIQEFPCDALFSSMPIKDLLAGMPQAPAEARKVAAALPYRDFVTVGLLVKKLALRPGTGAPSLCGVPDCWIYVQDDAVKLGRVQLFNNWSPYLVDDAQNTVWLGLEYFCREGDAFWNLPEAECARFAAEELRKIGVIAPDAPILLSHRERVPKAYPAYFDSYAQFPVVRAYLDTLDNLYCIGRNGQHRYNNMDHSMLTAMQAVDALLTGQGKRAVWEVNTEQKYHEESGARARG